MTKSNENVENVWNTGTETAGKAICFIFFGKIKHKNAIQRLYDTRWMSNRKIFNVSY